MSEADKLFEELGYTQASVKEPYIRYEKSYKRNGRNYQKCIDFDTDNKTFEKWKAYGTTSEITMQELKAIHKKAQELRVVR